MVTHKTSKQTQNSTRTRLVFTLGKTHPAAEYTAKMIIVDGSTKLKITKNDPQESIAEFKKGATVMSQIIKRYSISFTDDGSYREQSHAQIGTQLKLL